MAGKLGVEMNKLIPTTLACRVTLVSDASVSRDRSKIHTLNSDARGIVDSELRSI